MRVAVPFPIFLHMVMANCHVRTFVATIDGALRVVAFKAFLRSAAFALKILLAHHGREVFQLPLLFAAVAGEADVVQHPVGAHLTTSALRRSSMCGSIHELVLLEMELRPSPRLLPKAALHPATHEQLLVHRLPALHSHVAFAALALDRDILTHKAPVRSHFHGEVFLSLHLLATLAEDHCGRHLLQA